MAAYDYVQLTGTIIPDTVENAIQVENEYKDVFGQDLVVTANTPQGILITAEILSRDGIARNNAQLANQINPNLSGGVYLDAIWALTGGERIKSTFSVIPNVTVNGVPGTVLAGGSTAQYPVSGAIFQSVSTITIQPSGTASVDFQALTPGPVDCPINGLTQIVNGVLGWETVNNTIAATLGTLTESDVASRERRRFTLALQGLSLPEAINSALRDTANVKSNTFLENVTSSTIVKLGVTLLPHSVWVCVDGGTDNDVASTLLKKKSAGANWNGDVTVNVEDPTTHVVYPVSFDRPNLIPVVTRITIKNNTGVADPINSVKTAVLAYTQGLLDGEPGFVVGSSVSPFEIGGAVNREEPTLYVQKVEVSYSSVISYVTTELPIQIFEQATLAATDIQVVVL